MLFRSSIMTNGSIGLPGRWAVLVKPGSFFHNMSIVMSGTAIAQMIGFALMPVISRLFTSSEFGVYGSFMSVFAVLSTFVTLQYSQAIMLPKKKKAAMHLFFISCLSTALVTFLCVLVVVVSPSIIQKLIKAPDAGLLFLLPAATLVGGLNQSLQAWSVRVKAFKHTASSQIIGSLASSGTWLLAGMGQAGALGLAGGSVLASVLASLNLARVLLRDLRSAWRSATWERIMYLAAEFRDFPSFSAPQHLMNALSQGLPVLLLGHFYGIGVAGFYAFGMRVIEAPMQLVQTALRQVLFQKASETYNHGGNLKHLFLKTTVGLMAVALIPSVLLFVWAPQIFSWIFGGAWWDAGIFARWFTLWMFMAFCNVPSVLFARILRQQRNLFLYECVVLSSRTSILLVGGGYWSSLKTVVAFSVLGFVLNTALILWIGLLLFTKKNPVSGKGASYEWSKFRDS
jgi:lipopolysaccharide exporter